VTGRALAAALLAVAASATASVASAASAGSLDSTFSGDGKVTTRFEPGSHFVGGLAIQPDGKILVAGRVKGRFALARYNPNGTLDQTWGGDGLVETSLTRGTDGAQAVAVQANGKVVATGFAAGKGGRFAVVRYKSNGRLDPTFSGDGVKATDFTKRLDEAFDVAIQADGKIVLAGCTRVGMFLGGRFAIARYTSDGKLDLTLGGDGKLRRTSRPTTTARVESPSKATGRSSRRAEPRSSRSCPSRCSPSPATTLTARGTPRSTATAS
jgi:uncharacterized delta-60 repeat protein